MPKRSNRLIYAYWDDRPESLWEHCRRDSRKLEYMRDLPPLWEASEYQRRTIYAYEKRVRAKGVRLDKAKPNNLFIRTTSHYKPGAAADEYALLKRAMAVLITCWEPYVCGVRTKALDERVPDPGPFRAAWMLYVHPSLAGSIDPPDVPIVEAAPDGACSSPRRGNRFGRRTRCTSRPRVGSRRPSRISTLNGQREIRLGRPGSAIVR